MTTQLAPRRSAGPQSHALLKLTVALLDAHRAGIHPAAMQTYAGMCRAVVALDLAPDTLAVDHALIAACAAFPDVHTNRALRLAHDVLAAFDAMVRLGWAVDAQRPRCQWCTGKRRAVHVLAPGSEGGQPLLLCDEHTRLHDNRAARRLASQQALADLETAIVDRLNTYGSELAAEDRAALTQGGES